MAAVIAVAASQGPTWKQFAIALAYVAGAAIPLGLIAGWGLRAARRLGSISAATAALVWPGECLSAVLVLSGLDLAVENGVAASLPPGWNGVLTSSKSSLRSRTAWRGWRTTRG